MKNENGSELEKMGTGERILLTENTEGINDFKTKLTSEVQMCKTLLENLFQFENENAIPKNVDAYVWDLFLSSNEAARGRASYDKIFTLRNVNLPDHIERIYSDLNAWKLFPKRELSKYLIREKDCYSVNEKMVSESVELFADTQRSFAIGPDQIERYNFCKAALAEVIFLAKIMEINPPNDPSNSLTFNSFFKNPLLTKHSYPRNCFDINLDFIKTGLLQFQKPSYS